MQRKFSIVIANYNYERYVSSAIDSALNQSYENLEVIVVDDGSSDRSRDVIEAYGERIQYKFIENSGQRNANNIGFSMSSGDIVVFLDADDVLYPNALSIVNSAWKDGCSKLQGVMQRVGPNLEPLGVFIPKKFNAKDDNNFIEWSKKYCEYPSPPGSGNFYAREFLNEIFPIGAERDNFTDTTCIASAPYYGSIVTVSDPLVFYRMHGMNDSSMSQKPGNFDREIQRGLKRLSVARNAASKRSFQMPDMESLFHNTHILQLRVAAHKLTPEKKSLPNDSGFLMARHAITLPFRKDYNTLQFRLLSAAWSLATLIAPKKLAKRLIKFRFT